MMRMQHEPEACASDLGDDQSHYLLLADDADVHVFAVGRLV